MRIFNSASKVVFILMALAMIIGLFMKIIEPKDFIPLATMTFGFYFANKGDSNQPYLGK